MKTALFVALCVVALGHADDQQNVSELPDNKSVVLDKTPTCAAEGYCAIAFVDFEKRELILTEDPVWCYLKVKSFDIVENSGVRSKYKADKIEVMFDGKGYTTVEIVSGDTTMGITYWNSRVAFIGEYKKNKLIRRGMYFSEDYLAVLLSDKGDKYLKEVDYWMKKAGPNVSLVADDRTPDIEQGSGAEKGNNPAPDK
jgi:hypothetical protein